MATRGATHHNPSFLAQWGNFADIFWAFNGSTWRLWAATRFALHCMETFYTCLCFYHYLQFHCLTFAVFQQIVDAYVLRFPTVPANTGPAGVLQLGVLQSGGLQSRATDVRPGNALTQLGSFSLGAYRWGPTVSGQRF